VYVTSEDPEVPEPGKNDRMSDDRPLPSDRSQHSYVSFS
jgi:hypothetical protein